MRKAFGFVLAGTGAAALAGVALAASRDTHRMNVPLPDGSTARVEYVGNVPPRVTVVPAPIAPFGMFDRSMFNMQREIDAVMRQIDTVARTPVAAGPGETVAGYGSAPEGSRSVSVETTSNGSKSCTRTTEVTGQGAGKPPKVVTSLSGDCGPGAGAPVEKPTA